MILLALVFALSFLPACVTDPVTGKTSIGIDRTDDEEVAMAAPHASSFKAQYEGAYPDAEIQAYCERIVLGMAKKSPRRALPWNFTILNSSDVNAFALPGGTVCITRGLLWQLGSEAEFAG
ncbi:MAG: M48 family metalloprotease, partial [Phycisphaerales bacterium]|nr:M48 family metalloprotease [Phycisphaerales bacterium]